MKFIYISNTARNKDLLLDPSVRYRCFNLAESITRDTGHLAEVTSFNNFNIDTIENYDLFIFHRPTYSKKLEEILNRLVQLNKKFFCDYDDFIFNPDYPEQMSWYKNRKPKIESVIQTLNLNKKALMMFDNITVSTNSLEDQVNILKKQSNVFVIPNYLTDKWVSLTKYVIKEKKENKKIIGYFSGTLSHNLDFKIAEKYLAEIINKNDHLFFMIVGHLEMSGLIKENKIIRKEIVPYYEMPFLISQCNITIAPLENTDFNNCKSSIKFLESMSLEVPCLASPINDMSKNLNSGAILVEEKKWDIKLNKFLNEKNVINEKILKFKKNIKNFIVSENIDKVLKGYLS